MNVLTKFDIVEGIDKIIGENVHISDEEMHILNAAWRLITDQAEEIEYLKDEVERLRYRQRY